MKNKKWLTYTLGVLLTLIVLAVVAGAGFRIGMMQNVSGNAGVFAFHHNFDGSFHSPAQGNPHQGNDGFHGMRGNFHGNDRHGGGFSFFSPIFGLIKLAALGALAWIGYTFIKKSGWRLTRTAQAQSATEIPAPEAVESVSDGGKKDEA